MTQSLSKQITEYYSHLLIECKKLLPHLQSHQQEMITNLSHIKLDMEDQDECVEGENFYLTYNKMLPTAAHEIHMALLPIIIFIEKLITNKLIKNSAEYDKIFIAMKSLRISSVDSHADRLKLLITENYYV